MNTNLFSALVLASLASLSIACVNTSPTSDFEDDALAANAPSDSVDAPANDMDPNAKPWSPADKLVIPPQDRPYGASYEEWAVAYQQWVLSIPVKENPIADAPCELHQSGDVHFLAGNRGGVSERSCTIQRGRGIFIPLLNTVARSCPEMAEKDSMCLVVASDNGIRRTAIQSIDDANAALLLMIDGTPVHDLEQFRVQSDMFVDTSPKEPQDRLLSECSGPIEANSCGIPEAGPRTSTTNGTFVMLRQLSDGPHEIRMVGRVESDSIEPAFDITYNIFVSWPQPPPEL